MVRIDCLIFGYRRIKIDPSKISIATSRLLRLGISIKITPDGTFCTRERDSKKTHTALMGIEYTESDCLGLVGAYKRIKNKPLVFSAVLISLSLALFSTSFVWDVRVDGNTTLTDAEIVSALEKCGLGVGDFWPDIDRSALEAELLTTRDDVAWVNINRRGSVAYVSVIENEKHTENAPTEKGKYANIVATADCIIEEITVTRGTAVVKRGDAVKRGDLLISGTLPDEAGGGFCYAEGRVVGRMSDTVSVSVDRKYEKKVAKNKKITSAMLKLFKLNTNIFKSYRNLGEECDIIKEIKTFSLFGKARLPLEIMIEYAVEYSKEVCEYTDTELVSIASSRLALATDARLSSADLMKIRTHGGFTDEGYSMTNELVFTKEAGVPLEFWVE